MENYLNCTLNPRNFNLGIVVAMFICYLRLCAWSYAPQVFDRISIWINWRNHDMLVYVQAYALQVFDEMLMWFDWWKHDILICDPIHAQVHAIKCLTKCLNECIVSKQVLLWLYDHVMSFFYAIESWGYLILDNLAVYLEPAPVTK